MSETIIGIGIFTDSTINNGTVTTGIFDDSATNSGVTTNASFSGSSINTGTVIQNAVFTETAVNDGTINTAIFEGTSTNTGSVTGTVVFTGDAVNNGTVAEAIFLGNSQNGGTGTVTLSAVFAENAGNAGIIQGDAIFADNTVNSGTIQGNAEIAATADGEQGTVQGSVTEYVQPDGAFAYGYFSGGSKSAPASYATVVYQVGSYWYKYDASGNGALASGNYSDGTSWFTFANGVKVATYVQLKNGAYSDGYYVNGVIDTNYTTNAPVPAIDNQLHYTYLNGLGYIANGYYADSERYYINGNMTNLDNNGNSFFATENMSNLNRTAGDYDTYNGLFYQAGVAYSGTINFTAFPEVTGQDEYGNPQYGYVSKYRLFQNGDLVGTYNN